MIATFLGVVAGVLMLGTLVMRTVDESEDLAELEAAATETALLDPPASSEQTLEFDRPMVEPAPVAPLAPADLPTPSGRQPLLPPPPLEAPVPEILDPVEDDPTLAVPQHVEGGSAIALAAAGLPAGDRLPAVRPRALPAHGVRETAETHAEGDFVITGVAEEAGEVIRGQITLAEALSQPPLASTVGNPRPAPRTVGLLPEETENCNQGSLRAVTVGPVSCTEQVLIVAVNAVRPGPVRVAGHFTVVS